MQSLTLQDLRSDGAVDTILTLHILTKAEVTHLAEHGFIGTTLKGREPVGIFVSDDLERDQPLIQGLVEGIFARNGVQVQTFHLPEEDS